MTIIDDDLSSCLLYFVMTVFIYIISLYPTFDCFFFFFFSQGSIGNHLSASKVVVKSAYILPSLSPTLWNYTGVVVVVIV